MADNSYPAFYPPQAQFAYPSSNTNQGSNKVNDSAAVAAATAAAGLTTLDPTVDYSKTNNFDFLSFGQGTTDVLAPHPDLFESELDSSFATFEAELNLLPVDTTDVFTLLRSETPRYGPPSSFTVSSESVSGYDSSYAESESYYSFNPHSHSPTGYATGAASTFPFPQELDMDFQRLGLPASKDDARYHPASPSVRSSPGTVPTIAHYSPQTDFSSPRGSFSDYEPAQPQQVHIGSANSDYYPQVQLNKYPASMGQSTVTPSNVSPQIPSVPTVPSINTHRPMKSDAMLDDPKRKYQCPSCPRAFARAYNLKTHIQTHDPNRSKPYACHHKSCGRSFSRKHDLMRHLVSIHRISESAGSSSSTRSIGVDKASRTWCETCGKGWVGKGKEKGCECEDEK